MNCRIFRGAARRASQGKLLPLVTEFLVALFLVPVLVVALWCGSAQAQVVQNQLALPDVEHIFVADAKDVKEAVKASEKKITSTDAPRDENIDFKAPEVEFLKEQNLVKGAGGVVISGAGVQVQSDQATMNMESKQVEMIGNVLVSDSQGVISAQKGDFQFESETGNFSDARFTIEDGNYDVEAKQASKISEFRYELEDSTFSTCHCADGDKPWSFNNAFCRITQEGYAHSFSTTFDIMGVPVLYTPYIGFPVKTERTSGLLAPDLGYSDKHGFLAKLPFFVVIDDSTDLTITPFTETLTRSGVTTDYRQTFSRYNSLTSRFTYSDERARDGELQGTDTGGVYNPYPSDPAHQLYDDDRFGGYLTHSWSTRPGGDYSLGLYSDVHLVSDPLYLREFEDYQIGDRQARYLTSTSYLRSTIGEYVNAEVGGEYNQSFEIDQDTVLQRLPQGRVDALKSFRPFGFNPLGVKLATRGAVTTTDFVRKDGFDGWRTDVTPGVGIPLRYKNYFNSALNMQLAKTYYNLNDTQVLGSNTVLNDTSERLMPQFQYGVSSGVERVFDVDKDSWLTQLTSLGTRNQGVILSRFKHIVRPQINYTYIPDVSQDDLPFFDSYDRIRERSVVTYGVRTSLLGRFLPRNRAIGELAELTPEPERLPQFPVEQPVGEFGAASPVLSLPNPGVTNGEIRELLSLGVRQSFDYKEYTDNNDPYRDALSSIAMDISAYPTRDFGVAFGTNYNNQHQDLDSWDLILSTQDDRGDQLRTRSAYVKDPITREASLSQVDGNVEVAVTSRTRIGYYTRYDDREQEFIESQVGLRFSSACDCWHITAGYHNTINPDKETYLLTFTLGGLGDISQDILTRRGQER